MTANSVVVCVRGGTRPVPVAGADLIVPYDPITGSSIILHPDGTVTVIGMSWYSGSGAPSSGSGVNGDYYLNTATGDVYTKASGSWGSPVANIRGPAGTNGSTGAAGSTWYSGSGAPSSGTGVNGDYYLNTANGDVYTKASGSWGAPTANIAATATDLVARDQIALTNLRLLLNTGIATGALLQGKQWELLTNEWGGTSTGQTYTSGSPGYYGNSAISTASYANAGGSGDRTASIALTSTGSWGNPLSQAVDGVSSYLTNNGPSPATNASVSGLALTFDFGAGASKTITEVTLYQANGNAQGGIWQWQGSNNGSSWTNIGSPVDMSVNNQIWTISLAGNASGYRYYRYQGVSGTTGASSTNMEEFNFKIVDYVLPSNMTLLPPAAVSVSAAPTYADCFFLYKDDSGSAALGTDLTVELSRDGGTTWTMATLTSPLGAGGFDGAYAAIKARANLGGNPSGTSLTARIKTLNNKAQRVAAPALYAE